MTASWGTWINSAQRCINALNEMVSLELCGEQDYAGPEPYHEYKAKVFREACEASEAHAKVGKKYGSLALNLKDQHES